MWYRFSQSASGVEAGLDSDGNLTIKINQGNVDTKKPVLKMLGVDVDKLLKTTTTSPVFQPTPVSVVPS